MNKNTLTSLALVFYRPCHAYSINETIKEMDLENWAHISPASVYNTLNRLEQEGCVDVHIEKVENMPDRKVYSITSIGKERLAEELREAILRIRPGGDNSIYLALSFGYGLDQNDLTELLENRIDSLRHGIHRLNKEAISHKNKGIKHSAVMLESAAEHLGVQISTIKKYIEVLKTNPEYFKKLSNKICKSENGDR